MTSANTPAERYDPRRSLVSYVADLAKNRPDAPAIRLDDRVLSYGELMAQADRVAYYLTGLGIVPGDFVGIWANRSGEALVAMMGILRAGAAYVPLDPGYASEVQLRQIVEQVPFRAVLMQTAGDTLAAEILPTDLPRRTVAELATETMLSVADWPEACGEDPVCMVFTSGTTGKPKGVVLPNRGLASFGLDQTVIGVEPADTVLHASSLACDGGLIEVWLAFLNEASVAVVEGVKPALPDIAATMARHSVTVTSQYVGMQNLLTDHHAEAFRNVRLTMAGGDVQSPDHIRRLKAACPGLRYVNIYGPSETTCISLVQEVDGDQLTGAPVPIGRPMTHEWAFVLDEDLAEVPNGEWGQLAIGGHGVALGYFGMASKTAEVFIEDPRPGRTGKVYLTGDLAMRRADGVFEFGGRVDRQVKLGGRRIELDGIEHVLRACPGVRNAVVEVARSTSGDKRVGAVVQAEGVVTTTGEAALRAAILQHASQQLHAEMLPRLMMFTEELPLTTMGKPDRKAMRAMLEAALAPAESKVAPPETKVPDIADARLQIARIWQDMLGCGPLADDATFFDAGGSSLQLIDAHARIQAALGVKFDLMVLFETPQLGALSKALAKLETPQIEPETAPQAQRAADLPDNAIAIVGMAARIPGADNLDAFWDAVCEGRNLIHRFEPDELEDAVPPEMRADPAYVPARSILEDVDMFDAKFFGILPAEAAQMDPQARVFLEICVQALDDAGIDPARAGGPVGVFAGSSTSTYMLHNVLADRAAADRFTSGFQIENYTTLTGNITDSLSTRVAYKLNLTGPAMTVHTACSTSLTAIAQAVTALRAGQCDVALAGGVSITFPQKRGYMAQEGGMASPDGLCRPFDAQAQGTVFGHGAGVLVLKSLARALADGDRVEAVIRGVGLNNDGADKMSFTAPAVTGQAGAIRAAHADAGTEAKTVSFVECHGTATPLGDPIEIRALSQAFGPEGRCALGSVKGNIGHLDAGAGVISVIKTVRGMRERVIPPVAHFKEPNPRIDFAAGPFYVPTGREEWESTGPRRAGVSGFGVGGTNVHLVLEEAPESPEPGTREGVAVLPLSAKSPEALAAMAGELADHLEAAQPAMADVALTLQDGRAQHPYRLAVAAEVLQTAADRLRLAPAILRPAAEHPRVAFLFPGQGSQYPGMGRGLYEAEPVYRDVIDRGCEVLTPLMGGALKPLLAQTGSEGATERLRQTDMAQPALFLTQTACAALWASRGVIPDMVAGHSIGECAAAVIAGALSFEDGLRLVAARGRLMQAQQPGAMLSVRASLDEVEHYLGEGIDLAAANAPKLQAVAGPEDAIRALEARLERDGIIARRLATSHAFHSAMMAPAAEALAAETAGLTFQAPQLPMVSTMTGALQQDAPDATYWAAQVRAPVRFAAALEAMAGPDLVLLEAGAGATLTTLAAQTLKREDYAGAATSLPDHAGARSDAESIAQATGDLWAAGVDVDWGGTARGAAKLRLPGTHFIRKRHWIDPPVPGAAPEQSTDAAIANDPSAEPRPAMTQTQPTADRKTRLVGELATLFADLSGEDLTGADAATPFLELGFDSLFMGQAAQALTRDYGVPMTFRALLAEHTSLAALATHLDTVLPADAVPAPEPETQPEPVAVAVTHPQAPAAANATAAPVAAPVGVSGDVNALMQAQMQTMQQVFATQLQMLGQAAPAAPVSVTETVTETVTVSAPAEQSADSSKEKPIFKVGRAPALTNTELTEAQKSWASDLAGRYSRKFAGSKAHTGEHRAHHADPRSVAGFRPEWKELVFPIVATRSKGAWIEDVDGNRLVDLVNGFGQTAFGHAPEFVADAVRAQLERGYAIGPQSDMAGPVAARFAAMAGHERATFCNTGSEAVMAAMRLARTVTGREKIVVFGNDYHGQFDEVLVKGRARGEPGALPIAPGIPRDAVANMVVLPYADPASLTWITQNIDQIAAVVVEPVQSRHPELRPENFVRDLRNVTAQGGAALVMDEVVTGFRTHARGMQGVWDIHPDMATYGKVVGGGMPVGMLAGDARFMDALDGGVWDYGDDSAPQTAPTFFAGTFVRHPLVVAAVDAVLDELERNGEALWSEAADRCAGLAQRMNGMLTKRGLPELVTTYSSWFVLNVSQHDPRATLLHALMRLDGVHTLDGFCGFLTTEHGEAECDQIAAAFGKAVDALQSVGILAPESGTVVAPRQVEEPAPSGPVPLTESMREIWMTHQLGAQPSAAFNESVSLQIDGPLDLEVLQRSLDKLVVRHDALRLRFARDGENFEVGAPAPLKLVKSDGLDRVLRQEAETPFDLSAGMPARATLVQTDEETHVLILTAHHIVCDGWSFNTLTTELAALYTAEVTGKAHDLQPAPSFAALAAEKAAQGMSPQTEEFWRGVYNTVPDLPELPTDRPRGKTKSFDGATTTATFDAELLQDVRKAGAKEGCTLFATLFGALQITLGRLAGANDIVLGVPTGGQAALDVPETVGHLVNFLPIRAAFDPEEPAANHLSRVSDAVMQAFDHGDSTLGTLVRALGVERTLSRLPLTEVQFNLERVPDTLAMGPARMTLRANSKAAVNYDLFFNMVEGREGLRAEVDYSTALYDEATVQRWLRHLEVVLRALVDDASQPIADLPLMTAEEESRLAVQGTPERVDYPDAASLPDLIAQTVQERPEAEAIRDRDGVWTYGDLWAASGAIAAQVQDLNLPSGARVGVAMPRGKGMVAALLAVHRAGLVYVPLDPDQPLARQRQVLGAAQAHAVIAPDETSEGLTQGTRTIPVDPAKAQEGAMPVPEFVPVRVDPGSAAYVIFTSGSTGAPKGVSVPHRAVVNFLTSMAHTPGFTSRDKILAVTTVSFDIAVLELFLPLIAGGKVEIATRAEVMDGFALAQRLADPEITVMQATPTLWAMLVEAGFSPRVGLKMLAGGEPLPADLAETLAGGAELWNMYGPTETTIWSAAGRVMQGKPVTIGDPVANTELHVLDGRGNLCAPGVVGELNIGGDGLAIGYHERPDLTAAAFRPVCVVGQMRRLYRTGDLAVRGPDGTITLLGRRDGQVKLRGYRIELGEIEARLRAEVQVAAAAVAVRTAPSGADQLVAYVVPRAGDAMDASLLAEALAEVLPDYMVPAAWMPMEALPQTANGKLDRKALPDPEAGTLEPARPRASVRAATATEQKILAIWQEVLGLDTLSVTDTIFALGADSLSVFRIAARMMQAGLPLEARHVMEHGNIRTLAEFADQMAPQMPARPSLSTFRREPRTGT